jgi:two-component system, NarL family, sensor histidine kinase UhpB
MAPLPPIRPCRPAWLARRPATWLAIWLATCLAAALSATAAAEAATDALPLPRLTQAQVFEGDSLPPDDAVGTVRRLPDEWSHWRGPAAGPLWYRVELTLPPLPDSTMPAMPATPARPALWVERACSHFDLYVNGQWLTSSAPTADPGAAACHQPHLIALPPALLRPGRNRLDLRLSGEPLTHVASRQHAAGLSALELGPLARLAPRHARATAWQVVAPQAVSATLLLMGGFMFVLGWRHRSDSHLAYFGALSVGWALVEARRWLPGLPLSAATAEFLQGALLAFVTLAAVQFLLRYARWRSRRVDRLLWLQCLAMPATLWLAGPARLHAAAGVWTALFALQIAAAAVVHLRLRWHASGRLPRSALGLLATAGVALGLDLLGRFVALPPVATGAAQLAVPLALVVVGLRLMQQHGQALKASEASRVQLEQRIRDATAEIERNFRQLAELRVEQVTARERKRIAGDLHDDLGAKLLTIVHTSDDPRISTLAREALEEMRLSVRGLTGKPMRLADALGDWRAELMGRLAQSGIEGEWQAPDEAPQVLPARAYVQTTRILREATNNIVKHSAASRCSVSAALADDDLQIVIQDNGRGIPMEIDGRLDRGHGLASMKQRAKQMHGQCLVESVPGHGTVIRLTLPLGDAVAHAP